MLTTLLLSFVVFLLLRVPVAFSMAFSSLLALLVSEKSLPLQLLPQRMFVILDSTAILAIPFFILAGVIMERGGLSRRLIDFAYSMVAHWKGGLAQVDVIASTIFSALTGSSAASCSATGSIMIPAMIRKGYPKGFAAALESACAAIGPIIPPSIIMVVYGSITGVSVGKLFLAGVIPGILISIALLIVNRIYAGIYGWGGEKKRSLKEVGKAFFDAGWALFAPIIIICGILFGVFTPTEAGAVAVFYALFISMFIYKDITIKTLPKIILDAVYATASVAFIIAAAGIFGWILAVERVPNMFAEFVLGITTEPMLAMLIIIGFVLVLGCVLEVTAMVVILVPVFHPLGMQLGFNDIHFALVMCIAMVYGNVTPPVGLLLFLTSKIAKCSIGEIMKYNWVFILVLMAILILVASIPNLALFLPDLMMPLKQ